MWKKSLKALPIGKGEKLIEGEDVALLAVGSMVDYALKAADMLNHEGINCEVVNMRYIKPLDEELLDSIAGRFNKIITLEENALMGGFGSGVLEYFSDKNYKNDILRVGLPDEFIDHGTQAELHKKLNIDPEGIKEKVKIFVSGRNVTEEAFV